MTETMVFEPGKLYIRIGKVVAILDETWSCPIPRIERELNARFSWEIAGRPDLPPVVEQAAEHFGGKVLTPVPPTPGDCVN